MIPSHHLTPHPLPPACPPCRHRHLAGAPHGSGQAGGSSAPPGRCRCAPGCHPHRRRRSPLRPPAAAQRVSTRQHRLCFPSTQDWLVLAGWLATSGLLPGVNQLLASCVASPLACSRVRSRAVSPAGASERSQGSADENGGDSTNTGGAGSQRSKRPRRAASGGVLGAVAAEASDWGFELLSPPLKRSNSMPVRAGQSRQPAARTAEQKPVLPSQQRCMRLSRCRTTSVPAAGPVSLSVCSATH